MRTQDTIIGNSVALARALEHVSRLATVNRPVLILGERGTGKELAAERLHYLSARWDAPLVKVNCAAMAESLLESELFGHEAGAFTGAVKTHIGHFERADGGTLILDVGASLPFLRRLIHHEVYHFVDLADDVSESVESAIDDDSPFGDSSS